MFLLEYNVNEESCSYLEVPGWWYCGILVILKGLSQASGVHSVVRTCSRTEPAFRIFAGSHNTARLSVP